MLSRLCLGCRWNNNLQKNLIFSPQIFENFHFNLYHSQHIIAREAEFVVVLTIWQIAVFTIFNDDLCAVLLCES